MTLRPLQHEFIGNLRTAFSKGNRSVLGVAATGFGKTVCFAYMSAEAEKRGNRTLILTHRTELEEQIRRALSVWGSPATVGSIQTIARRLDATPVPDFIVVDECHHATAASWSKVLTHWPSARVLGVTATPARLDGRGLGSLFQAMVLGPDAGRLIEDGLLCRPRYFAPTSPDVSELGLTGGDYNRDEVARLADRPGITGSAVAEYQKRSPDAPALAFCVTREHAAHVAEEFRSAGVNALEFHGGLPKNERKERMEAFRSSAVRMLVTIDLVGEGLDVPSVGAVILLRPTASLCLHLQQIGRGLRISPGKTDVVILDHAGNLARHGLAEWPREWSLEGVVKRPRSAVGLAVIRCPQCFAVSGVRGTCGECGHEFTAQERELAQRTGDLQEVVTKVCPRCGDPTIAGARCGGCAKRERVEESRCRTMADWAALGKSRGCKPGWAWMRWKARAGRATVEA